MSMQLEDLDLEIERINESTRQKRQKDSMDRIFKRRETLPQMQEEESFHRGPTGRGRYYIFALWSFAAALIDALVCFSIGCIFTLSFVLLSAVSYKNLVLNLGWNVLFIFAGVSAIYMIMLRALNGQTLGEWACGIYLGTPEQQKHPLYPVRVIDRVLILFATGLITLPILSLLFQMDLASRFSKLQLHKEQ